MCFFTYKQIRHLREQLGQSFLNFCLELGPLSQPHFGAKCENATHTPKSGKMESSETPKNLEDDLRGQIPSS